MRGRPKSELVLSEAEREQLAQSLADLAKQAKEDGASLEGLEDAIAALKAGNPEKGLALLNTAFEACTSAEAASTMGKNMVNYGRDAEIEVDGAAIIEKLLAPERSFRRSGRGAWSPPARPPRRSGTPSSSPGRSSVT